MRKCLSLCLMISFCILLLHGCGINSAPDFLHIDQIGTQYSADFCGQPIREEQLGILSGMPYAGIDKDSVLQVWQDGKWQYIAENVYAAVPIQSGFSYLKADGLYFYDFSKASRICDDAEALCTDGQTVFYYDMKTHVVCAYDGEQRWSVFQTQEDLGVVSMLANAKWIIIFTSKETIVYNREEQEFLSLNEDLALLDDYDPRTMFLWNSFVFQIGEASLGGRIFDLDMQEVRDLDLGQDLRDHFTTITTLSTGGTVYLSVQSLLNPKYGDELWESTLQIDGASQTAVQICPEFYKNLLCDQNRVYGSTMVHATALGSAP